jgi:protocatechuate 4,5-dioxygenase beta chain
MATIVGGIGTSHIPAIANAIRNDLHPDPYWQPFFDGYRPVHDWLAEVEPTVAVVFYNDHGLNFFLDAMPTFAIGAADQYASDDEGWGIGTVEPFDGHPGLSWHVIESVVDAGFDPTTCQEMRVDHGFWVPTWLLWPERPAGLRVIPIHVNTVQHPLAPPARCEALGIAVGDAIRAWPGDERVVVIGSGGLSHQLEGRRAGYLNPGFDRVCLDALASDDTTPITRLSIHELVELAGSQGVEVINWLAMRGALGDGASERHRNYHVPISNTAAAVQVLDTAPIAV